MNLLADQWLPVIRADGTREKIAVYELLDGYSHLGSPMPSRRISK
jgi:hypothetical protein